jgi:dipeptidyl aminopeptidase/acylaminoacyl peptidase
MAWVRRTSILFVVFVLLALVGFFIYRRLQSPTSLAQRTLTRLTFDDGLQIGASWSPDGRYIAYSSDRGGKFDIWVQQVSGGNPVQITKGLGQHWQPDWSPDGKYIAYRSEEGDGGIYVIPGLGGAGLERKIAPFGYYPRWSPDSSQVLFQTHFSSIDACNRFFVAQLDGIPPREVMAEALAQNQLCAASAAWYPDGKRITAWVGTSSLSPAFWTAPLAGGPNIKLEIAPAIQRELAQASGDVKAGQQLGEYSFAWSPSGNAIYFERGYRGAKNIWKMTVDPGMLRATRIDRLTTGPGPDAALAVSSDGTRLTGPGVGDDAQRLRCARRLYAAGRAEPVGESQPDRLHSVVEFRARCGHGGAILPSGERARTPPGWQRGSCGDRRGLDRVDSCKAREVASVLSA